jgi:uncharacterized caspase-like protein
MRPLLWLAFALSAAALLVAPARAEKRVALVIGNAAYQHVMPLRKAAHDAAAIAGMFRNAGFDQVIFRKDVGGGEFGRALHEFAETAKEAEIAVIYYAGHGIQVRDMNHMIPVDARMAAEADAEREAVSLDRILAAVAPARRLRLILVDASRDNPFATAVNGASRSRPAAGLGRLEPTMADTLIAYATKAGSVALDGDGEHSPFATALIRHLTVPGLDIRLAFGRIRDDVLKATGNRQEPFVYGSLASRVVSLVPASSGPAAGASDIQRDFDLVKVINSRQAWEIFIRTHKSGPLVDAAREELRKLDETR